MNKFMSVVISLAMLLVAAGKVCAQTDSAQVAAKQYREDIEAVLNSHSCYQLGPKRKQSGAGRMAGRHP